MQTLQLADGGKRVVAFIIDAIVLYIAQMILFAILGTVGFASLSAQPDMGDMSDGQTAALMAYLTGAGLTMILITMALQVAYFTILESSESQATLGKRAMNLIVADENGNRLNTQQAFIRNISRLASSIICYIGYFMAFFTDKKQALHDMIAKTNVYTK
ncbi:MAG: RDD family protein [Arcicella sp.]|nr:RDD family protein [Arcicella sp.]